MYEMVRFDTFKFDYDTKNGMVLNCEVGRYGRPNSKRLVSGGKDIGSQLGSG
jgi:hypothetical protein